MTSPNINTTTTGIVAHNGPVCPTCARPYIGHHECSIEDLLERADYYRRLAMEKFERLSPRPTIGPFRLPEDRTAGCPCRPENGGSGVCGCVLGGPQIVC